MADESEALQYSPCDIDIVGIKHLQLPFGVVTPNVWGQLKEQPALLSLTLTMSDGFGTAADKDVLDQNTLHYGELAKRIRAGCTSGQTLNEIVAMVVGVISDMGMRKDGTCRLSQSVIHVNLPKGSMYGKSVDQITTIPYDGHGNPTLERRLLRVQDMKLMALIGVNNHERQAKQPLVVQFEIVLGEDLGGVMSTHILAISRLEKKIVQTIEGTSFETLESLASFAVIQMQDEVLSQALNCSQVRLSIDKPRAIAFADAPGVEVLRQVRKPPSAASKASGKGREGGKATSQLKVIKPYT